MIDRIRQEIQERLEQLLNEAEKLRDALAALDPRDQKSKPQRSSSTSRSATPSTASPAASRTAARSTSSRRTNSRASAPSGSNSRTAPGATKNSVLSALEQGGGAMTAGEVATATGLGRGTVSTTLSKLAKSGVVVKADRGYKLPDGASAKTAA